jgi:hypothetical protein
MTYAPGITHFSEQRLEYANHLSGNAKARLLAGFLLLCLLSHCGWGEPDIFVRFIFAVVC